MLPFGHLGANGIVDTLPSTELFDIEFRKIENSGELAVITMHDCYRWIVGNLKKKLPPPCFV